MTTTNVRRRPLGVPDEVRSGARTVLRAVASLLERAARRMAPKHRAPVPSSEATFERFAREEGDAGIALSGEQADQLTAITLEAARRKETSAKTRGATSA
jgi:hypothetical protein